MKARKIASWILTILLGVAFGLIGLTKMGGMAGDMFVDWGYPAWFALVVGAVEAIGGILLVIPRTLRFGVFLLTVVMVGAAATHLLNSEAIQILRPAAFGCALWLALWLRKVEPPVEE